MMNPWMMKNPFMSMWLSGANSVAGSMRGQMLAESQRMAATLMTQGAQQVFDYWLNFWTAGMMKRPGRKT